MRIPAGVADGQRIRLKGRGAPGRNGGPPGDLFVDVPRDAARRCSAATATTSRSRVPVTFAEAVLGADVEVPTLEGATVKLRVKPGTQSGSKHRVKGRGVATKKRTGDLIVTTDVVVPTKLSDAEERKAVEELAEATTDSPRAHLGG